MPLTAASRAWLADALDAAPNDIRIEPMAGATSSSVYAVRTQPGVDAVLRLFDNAAWLADEPDLVAHEAAALGEADRAGCPAPRLIAWSAEDVGFGAPALLMSRLSGEVVLSPGDQAAWIERLAFALAAIHRHPAVDLGWNYFPWFEPADAVIPAWSPNPSTWDSAIAIARHPAPVETTVYIHRDFHPVNVLWESGEVSGIVDWVNACRGPASVDVAHCRCNLALMYGAAVADAFLAAYVTATPGFRHDPYWDVGSLLEWALPQPTPYRPWAEFGLSGMTVALMEARAEAYLARLLARYEDWRLERL
ncbi:MAG TPA: aminoglycoside phosphotransferase family protein [Thermoflexales bacterium]|nr:aminoglycoside phosphotransferase family protein [Thermoflexales bacterium]